MVDGPGCCSSALSPVANCWYNSRAFSPMTLPSKRIFIFLQTSDPQFQGRFHPDKIPIPYSWYLFDTITETYCYSACDPSDRCFVLYVKNDAFIDAIMVRHFGITVLSQSKSSSSVFSWNVLNFFWHLGLLAEALSSPGTLRSSPFAIQAEKISLWILFILLDAVREILLSPGQGSCSASHPPEEGFKKQ